MKYFAKIICGKILLSFFLLINPVIIYTSKAQTVKADSTRFPIGGKIDLIIEVPAGNSDIINWPVLKDTITGSLEILSQSKVDTIINESTGERMLKKVLSITSFDTGFIAMPPFSFDVIRNGTLAQTLKTEPILFEVYKVKVDPSSEIKDIKPILKAPLTIEEIIPWLALLLLLGLLIYLILHYLKKRREKPVIKHEPKIITPAWDIAIKKLDLLKAEKLSERGDIKEYYTRLTDILREYFELRFGVNAAEMTSTEIMDAMKIHMREEITTRYLKEILILSDMAKFAKAKPGVYDNEQSIKYGYEIVNNTKPQISESNSKASKPE